MALESGHIAQHSSRSKRRPDIIATYTSTLRDKYEGHEKAGFDDWVQIINDEKEIQSVRCNTPVARRSSTLGSYRNWDASGYSGVFGDRKGFKGVQVARPIKFNTKPE